MELEYASICQQGQRSRNEDSFFIYDFQDKNRWMGKISDGIGGHTNGDIASQFVVKKMKEVSGINWYLWGAGFLACLTLSMTLLAKAAQTLPIGTAYPVWIGIGGVGTVVLGILFFHESAYFLRQLLITTLIISILGLKMVK